jgi:WD40 repeat protein
VYALAMSSDATTLASGSGDGTVRIWSAIDGRLLATLVHLTVGKDEWAMITPLGHYATSSVRAFQWKNVPEEFTLKLRDDDAVRSALKVRAPARRSR